MVTAKRAPLTVQRGDPNVATHVVVWLCGCAHGLFARWWESALVNVGGRILIALLADRIYQNPKEPNGIYINS